MKREEGQCRAGGPKAEPSASWQRQYPGAGVGRVDSRISH